MKNFKILGVTLSLFFILTDLFKSIVKWEKENGIKILDQNILNAA